jgi:hypothetical protein
MAATYVWDKNKKRWVLVSDIVIPEFTPPPNKYKVTNLYVDPPTKRLVVEYDSKI